MPDERFPPRLRLATASQYDAVFRSRCRSGDRLFSVVARRNGLGYPRLGLAIGKRSIPGAVRRNQVKRQVRESFRRGKVRLRGLDVVVVAKADARRSSHPEIRASLEQHWDGLRARCKRSS